MFQKQKDPKSSQRRINRTINLITKNMNCPQCNTPMKGRFCGKCGYQIQDPGYEEKCTKCSSPLKPNAKFCGTCGAPVGTVSSNGTSGMKCSACGTLLKPNAKFCGVCGAPVKKTENSQKDKDISEPARTLLRVGNRISWGVQQGELALRINEADFLNYDDATGIIINDGIHTVLKANGQPVAELSSGIYDFVSKNELETALNTRVGGVPGLLRRGFRFFSNLILGTRVDEMRDQQGSQHSNNQVTFNRIIDDLKKGAVFSATMVLERSFPLIFEFENVQTKFLDTKVGLHAFFKVSDFSKFSKYYLTDKSLISFAMIKQELGEIIKASLVGVMTNYEQENVQLPENIQQDLLSALQQINPDLLNGIAIERVVTVTSKNEDLERLRRLAGELYLSEKELDYQRRLAEFRNRLTLQVNAQKLNDARNENEFEREMNEINKDGILTKDDFDKFLMVVSKERIIRESQNEEDISIALNEIRKTGLLRDEDLQNLVKSIEERSEDRERNRFFSIELMQMDHASEVDRKKLEWEYEIGDKRIQLELDRKRKVDEYTDSRQEKDLEFETRKKKTQIEIDKEEMEAQLELLRKTSQIKQEQDEAVHKREAELIDKANAQQLAMEQKKMEAAINRLEKSKDLTPEQLMAIAANENLSPEAAKAFAESFSAKYSSESTKDFMDKFNQLNESRISDAKKNADDQREFMEKIMDKVLTSQATMTGHLVNSQKELKDEYRGRLNTTEQRLDSNQDKSLNYVTKQNENDAANNTGRNLGVKECPNCKFMNDTDVNVCVECGFRFE